MRRYQLVVPPAVEEVIRSLHPDLKKEIRSAHDLLSADPLRGSALRAELKDRWRYRVRRHRIIYRIDVGSRVVRVIAVGPRGTIYDELAAK